MICSEAIINGGTLTSGSKSSVLLEDLRTIADGISALQYKNTCFARSGQPFGATLQSLLGKTNAYLPSHQPPCRALCEQVHEPPSTCNDRPFYGLWAILEFQVLRLLHAFHRAVLRESSTAGSPVSSPSWGQGLTCLGKQVLW